MNPADHEMLVTLANGLNLDQTQFKQLLQSRDVEETLQQEITTAAALGVSSFPSLVLVDSASNRSIDIQVDYLKPEPMLQNITQNIID